MPGRPVVYRMIRFWVTGVVVTSPETTRGSAARMDEVNSSNPSNLLIMAEYRYEIRECRGSNLFLDRKKARGSALKPWSFLQNPQDFLEMVGCGGLNLDQRTKFPLPT